MPDPTIHDLPHDVLAAFFGTAPLDSAQPYFASRQALFQAYAQAQVASFGTATAQSDSCDLCNARETPVAWLAVSWTGRIRWHKRRLALVALLSPILVGLAMLHVLSVIAALFKDFALDERLSFATVHPVCGRCRRRLRFRAAFHSVFLFITLFMGIISTGAAVISGAIALSGLGGFFNMNRRDAVETLPYFLLALGVALVTLALSRLFALRLLLPPAVHRLVKRPFRYAGHEVTASPPLCS